MPASAGSHRHRQRVTTVTWGVMLEPASLAAVVLIEAIKFRMEQQGLYAQTLRLPPRLKRLQALSAGKKTFVRLSSRPSRFPGTDRLAGIGMPRLRPRCVNGCFDRRSAQS